MANKIVRVLVLGTTGEGSEFYGATVDVTQEQYDEGEHYELAKELAREQSFEEPMMAFDENDVAAKQLGADFQTFFED